MKNPPYVSVIVPFYNAEATIKKLVESLLRQTYPPDSYEIILVNNDSNDRTVKIIDKYPVNVLNETKIKSSYAARNTGILSAKGEIFAFIDADCIAAQNWIENGVKALRNEGADLAGGKINFIFSKAMSASEIYDAITHLDSGSNVKNMRTAATANLFVRSAVFHAIGLFPDNIRSGGDMQFTHKAVSSGYKLVYAENARIFHPTRNFPEMLKKSYRVGTGCIDVLLMRNTDRPRILLEMLRYFLPQSLRSIRRNIGEKINDNAKKKSLSVFFVGYLFRISRGLGMLSNIKRIFQKNDALADRNFAASNISG
jgi:glycosyltransferase involved in cell wall biosynthesis